MTMEKQYLVDWDVWNARTQTYEPEGLCDWVYADDEEEAVDLMMGYIIENSDGWDIERESYDVVKLHREEYDPHEDRIVETSLEYRNFRIHPTE